MKNKIVLVTGGTGFIGSAVVRGLVGSGARVRVLDNNSRGKEERLHDVAEKIEYVCGDIRDLDIVQKVVKGVDTICHLAYINGTEFFYQKPELILEVAVKGMMNVLDAAIKNSVRDFILASSSEVYQRAETIPTPETVPMIVPDVLNPRYSYGGGKIICELLLMNYADKHFDRAVTFRPHNVYGPDMGNEHVIPQFSKRMKSLIDGTEKIKNFEIQGSGEETRAFIYIDDFVDAFLRICQHGQTKEIYNIGTRDEISIKELALLISECFGEKIEIKPSPLQAGSTQRRCPDISKIEALDFSPKTDLKQGIKRTTYWYRNNC